MNAQGGSILTVLIANHNTSPFLALSLHALDVLTESPYEVLVHDDGSATEDVAELERLAAGFTNVTLFRRPPDSRGGSFAHGRALDFLMSKVRTPYTAVMDADCTPLLRGWDCYLISQLDDRTKIVGSTLGEGWSGKKPIDFPLPFLALFETEPYRRLGISAMPEDPVAGRDSCWEWREKYLAAGLAGKCLRSENTRFGAQGPFEGLVCGVYFADDGRIVGSHLGRGSNLAGKRSRWPSFIDGVLRRFRGGAVSPELLNQRERWMAICRRLIDEQARERAVSGG